MRNVATSNIAPSQEIARCRFGANPSQRTDHPLRAQGRTGKSSYADFTRAILPVVERLPKQTPSSVRFGLQNPERSTTRSQFLVLLIASFNTSGIKSRSIISGVSGPVCLYRIMASGPTKNVSGTPYTPHSIEARPLPSAPTKS